MSKNNPVPRLALVTGADGGIGSAFCRNLAAKGIDLVIVGINESGLDKLAAGLRGEYNIRVWSIVADLTSEEGCGLIESFKTPEGEIPDLIINNAGIFSFLPVCRLDDKKCKAFIDLHVMAVTRLSRHFGSIYASKGYGWILNMSSMSCWMPMPGLAMYAATKSYIRVFSRSLNYELRDAGVKVMVACPGGIATTLFGLPENLMKLALRLGAVVTPDKFAERALKQLFRGRKQYINGITNRMAIFFVGILPDSLRMLIKRKLLDRGITR